jgi:23S rRNA G2445 N2-methylase RlmL
VTKDAIVDRLRELRGTLPDDTESADADPRHAQRRTVTVSVNLAGDSLHLRGCRQREALLP